MTSVNRVHDNLYRQGDSQKFHIPPSTFEVWKEDFQKGKSSHSFAENSTYDRGRWVEAT